MSRRPLNCTYRFQTMDNNVQDPRRERTYFEAHLLHFVCAYNVSQIVLFEKCHQRFTGEVISRASSRIVEEATARYLSSCIGID